MGTFAATGAAVALGATGTASAATGGARAAGIAVPASAVTPAQPVLQSAAGAVRSAAGAAGASNALTGVGAGVQDAADLFAGRLGRGCVMFTQKQIRALAGARAAAPVTALGAPGALAAGATRPLSVAGATGATGATGGTGATGATGGNRAVGGVLPGMTVRSDGMVVVPLRALTREGCAAARSGSRRGMTPAQRTGARTPLGGNAAAFGSTFRASAPAAGSAGAATPTTTSPKVTTSKATTSKAVTPAPTAARPSVTTSGS